MKNELVKSFAKRLFKCHWIMFFVSFIFTFFFGGFLSIERPINGYIFTSIVILGYGFFLYSESVIEARKNFYNVNGDREKIDIYLGFKSGAMAHIFMFAILLITLVFYFSHKWFGISIWFDNIPIHTYLNILIRFILLPFLSFFPSSDIVAVPVYLVFMLFPSLVCGFSYLKGLHECRTIKEIEDGQYK